MRVDAYNQVSQVYQTTAQAKIDKEAITKRKNDKLEISQIGKDIQLAKQIIQEQPDIREDKVQEIKARMSEGTYEVSMSDVAEKMLSSLF